jgi:hypothetical protein
MLKKTVVSAAVATMIAGTVAARAMPMNGMFWVHYDKQSPQPTGPDRVQIDESGSGVNRSPGQPLDNAQVTLEDSVTLVKGQGPVKGRITLTTPDGSVTSTLQGKVTTDPQGRLMAVGSSKVVEATGAFVGMKGNGDFTTTFSSPTDQVTQWQGNFKPPAGMASNR